MKNLCIKCKIKPIFIKKRELCHTCYQKAKRTGLIPIDAGGEYRTVKAKNQREMDFIRNYFKHSNWSYEPALFRMDGEKYSPDFYDGEMNVFIEVVGTRQAYSENKDKYNLLRKYYPKINFEIRLSDGSLLDETKSIHSQVELIASKQ